jgi:hypothetical protein
MDTKEIINKIKGLNLTSYPYFEVQELIRSLGTSGFLIFTLHFGKAITRARLGHNYFKKSELSYKSQEFNTKCQRASTPNRTMFYGTIIEEEYSLEKSRMIAISECSPLLRGGIDTNGIEKITYGKWTVIDNINLVSIVNRDVFVEVANNPLLNELKGAYDEFINMESGKQENIELIAQFFAKEFSKKEIQSDSDYFISAVFSEIVSNDLRYDGILYPSVQAGGQLGFNVAITPEAVDTKMRLDLVAESTLYKKGEKSLNLIDKISGVETWRYINSPQMKPEEILSKLQIDSLEELTKM